MKKRLGNLQKKHAERPAWEHIQPKEIEGLYDAMRTHTVFGARGVGKITAHAFYFSATESFVFTSYTEYGRSPEVTFTVSAPMLSVDQIITMKEQNQPEPPLLISDVVSTIGYKQSFMELRAAQHNMFHVKKYLANGGEESLLVPTKFLPPIENLRKEEEPH